MNAVQIKQCHVKIVNRYHLKGLLSFVGFLFFVGKSRYKLPQLSADTLHIFKEFLPISNVLFIIYLLYYCHGYHVTQVINVTMSHCLNN